MLNGNKLISAIIIIFSLFIACEDGFAAFKQIEGCGIWAESDLPIKYVIDTDSFLPEEATAIKSAFDKWGSVLGSRLTFIQEDYVSQTLIDSPNNSPIPQYVLVTKKKITEIPSYYQSLLLESGGAAAFPFYHENMQRAPILGGSIIFRTKPVSSNTLFPDTYSWSTSNQLTDKNRDIESVALHEIGHLIGLAHPDGSWWKFWEEVPSANDAGTVIGSIAYGELIRNLLVNDVSAVSSLYPAVSNTPTINQTPTSGFAEHVEFTQSGNGFTPNTTAKLNVRKPDLSLYDPLDVTINNSGQFAIPYKPTADKAPGNYTWWVVDKYGSKSNELTYQILNYSFSPTIAQTPMKATPGTTLAQWGTGFTPNSTATLHFRKPDGTYYPELSQPMDSIGHFDIRWTAPLDKPPGIYTWWATDTSGVNSNPVNYEITSRSPAVYNFTRTQDPIYGDPDSSDSNPNFSAGYSIKNDGKQQIIIETLALAIHHADNQHAWDLKIPGTSTQRYYYNVTLDPGETKIFATSSCYFKDTDVGNYLVVAKAQIAGEWRELKYLNFTVRGNSSGVDSYLKISSPNGGESWQQGSSHTITWSKSGTVGSDVKIELYKGGNFYSTITSSTANDGTKNWDIPSTLSPGGDYKIRITSLSYPAFYDYSNNTFTITKIPNGGAISGRVTDSDGVGIPSVQVYVVTPSNSGVTNVATDANGFYFVDGLASGSYKVRFDGRAGDYRLSWYNGMSDFNSAALISVTSPSETSGISTVLEQGGALSGKVTDSSGNGLANIWVTLDDRGLFGTSTDVYGNYVISGIGTGNYKISFNAANSGYISEWYNDKPDANGAEIVSVTSPEHVIGRNAVLSLGGVISGKVTDTNGDPVYNAWVSVNDTEGTWGKGAYTDVYGNYTVSGLSSGTYRVYFNSGLSYIGTTYKDIVSLTAPGVKVVDQVLVAANGSISGKVSDQNGVGIASGYVQAYDANNNHIATVYTDYTGNYSLPVTGTGNYKLHFGVNYSGYTSTWHNSKTDISTADAVFVYAPYTTNGINEILQTNDGTGSISGKVMDSNGNGIQGIYVEAYRSSNDIVKYYQTDRYGNYTLSSLPAGNYKINFSARNTGYISKWHNHKADYDSADFVVVAAGASIVDFDTTMAEGGQISGKVIDSSGAGIAGFWVYASDPASVSGNGATTQIDGSYTIVGLPTGSYKLTFNGNSTGYIPQWYNNKTSYSLADAVAVTAGTTTSGINATLLMGGTITGKVTNSAGAGIAGVYINVIDMIGNDLGMYIWPLFDGSYTIAGLPEGSYKLQFNGNGTGYINQWYNNKTSRELADAVTVASGNTTPGINATLVLGGTISGKVINAAGVGIAGVSVGAFGSDAYGTSTQSDGSYSITGLPTGNYNLQFYGNAAGYISQWYNNKTSQELADAVSVTPGNTTHGIDATLTLGGTIAGKVTDSTGAGIGNVDIRVYDAANPNGSPVMYASTDSIGLYSASGLATGNYKLQFYGNDTGYISQWYSNKTSQELADVVTVTAGDTTPGINATLVLGGTITGKVTNASGVSIEGAYRVYISVIDATGHDLGMYIFPLTDGNYSISGLPEGSYKLRFNRNGTEYLTQWYSNKTSQALADAVTVTAGVTTGGINATMILGGSITGRVTNSAGAGIADVMVYASDASGGSGYGYGFSQLDGSYTIVGLPTGSYKLEFQGYDSVYLTQWYSNKTSWNLSDAVSVVAGVTTSGINATMVLGGNITGRVANSSGSGIADFDIYVTDPNGNYVGSYGWAQSDGSYTIAGLPAGSYKLHFNSTGFITQWYNNKASFDLADSVSVTAGATTSSINATMQNNWSISVTMAGSGSGTVNSNPEGIHCTSGTCDALFNNASTVNLYATASANSLFSGWSDGCSSTDCNLIMTGDKTVTANFTAAPKAKVGIKTFTTLQSAYDDSGTTNGSVIKLLEGLLDITLNAGRGMAVKLEGGYNSSYDAINSETTIKGPVKIRAGTVRMKGVKVR